MIDTIIIDTVLFTELIHDNNLKIMFFLSYFWSKEAYIKLILIKMNNDIY